MDQEDANETDAERYRMLRLAAWIPQGFRRVVNGKRTDVISFPTIPADPRTDGVDYRARFDASIDRYIASQPMLQEKAKTAEEPATKPLVVRVCRDCGMEMTSAGWLLCPRCNGDLSLPPAVKEPKA